MLVRRTVHRLRAAALPTAALAVLAGGSLGLVWHHREMMRPGASAPVPAVWPSGSVLAPPRGAPRLVIFAHPRCPCTPATLEQIRTLGSPERAALVLTGPALRTEDLHGRLARRAAELGLEVLADPDGAEARRFGALTSGHVLAYASDGRLRFSGGLTPMRGASGPSRGLRLLRERLTPGSEGAALPAAAADVLGCPIFDTPDTPTPGGACCGSLALDASIATDRPTPATRETP